MLRHKLLAYIERRPGVRLRELRKAFPGTQPRALTACLGRLRKDGQIELRATPVREFDPGTVHGAADGQSLIAVPA
jgi:DNA-binding HxlR family transcriptional regulator